MAYNQGNRYLYLETPLGDNQLLLQSFTGTEGLSQLFDFHLELLADNSTTVNFDQLIGQKVSFGVQGTDAGQAARDFNGIVVEFAQGIRDQEFTAYRMRVMPDIWKLTKTYQSRIFQHITVPDILKQVLSGFDVSLTDIQGTFEQREYCTQYRETDFDFLSRLTEEEGIYYFFKFTHGAHKLVLGNTQPSHPDIPGDSKVIYETTGGGLRDEERITWWQKEQLWGSGKYTTWDHHFQLPHRHNEAQATSGISVPVGKVTHKLNLGGNEKLEVFDYPAAYAQRFDGIDKSGGEKAGDLQKISPDAKRTDDIRIQQQETPMLRIRAISSCRQMTAGHKFTLQRHFNCDGKYVVLWVSHSGAEADFRANQADTSESHYSNRLACLPYDLPFRPPQVTRKPVIAGSQTAVVVGPGGEEIFTDKYGRVKVQFHWDRQGKYDGDSSCWLRVGTLWSGKQWGSVFIPRIGHEVIVVFLEGDPDRPIIVGSVYNADTMPPYELPANKTRSGIKTDTSIGSGGFNEIRFEDKKGSEQIFIHGQMDSDTRIESDCREWIGNDRHLIVKRDEYQEVDRDLHIDIKRDHKEKIEGDRHVTVQGKEAIQISKTRSLQVTGMVAEKFSANHSEQTSKDFYLQAMTTVLQANQSITLKVGGNFINIAMSGISIVGSPMVNINSGGSPGSGSAGSPDTPAAPEKAKEADTAIAGSEVVYSGGGGGGGGGSAPEVLKGPNDGTKVTGNHIDLVFDPSKSSKVTKCDRIVHVQFVRTYADGSVIKRGDWINKFKFYDKVTTADGWSNDFMPSEKTPDYQQGTGDGHKNGGSGNATMSDGPGSGGGDKGFYDPVKNTGGWKEYKAEFATYAWCMKGPDCGKWYEGVTWEYKKTWEDARDGKLGVSKITDDNVTTGPTKSQLEAFDLFNKDKGFVPCK